MSVCDIVPRAVNLTACMKQLGEEYAQSGKTCPTKEQIIQHVTSPVWWTYTPAHRSNMHQLCERSYYRWKDILDLNKKYNDYSKKHNDASVAKETYVKAYKSIYGYEPEL